MNGHHEGSPLDAVISAGVAAGDWQVGDVTRALGDGELYVRMAVDNAGNYVFVTSAVPQMDSLIQAYTSRSRPGIMYGGMTWSAIVDVLAKSPGLNGLHIINDRDDWIVVTRDDL